jgi:hypothetical protein
MGLEGVGRVSLCQSEASFTTHADHKPVWNWQSLEQHAATSSPQLAPYLIYIHCNGFPGGCIHILQQLFKLLQIQER